MRRVELAIVGGGPAGLSTALHLVRLDPSWSDRLVVLEKAVHPRHKLCGGGVTQFGLRHLRRLELTPNIPFVPVEQAHFSYGRQQFSVHGQPLFIVTRREEFDAWLAGQARQRGVQILENCPVQRIDRTASGFQLQTAQGTVIAQAIVGADGARGLVRRWIGAQTRTGRVARLLEVVQRASGREMEYRERLARFDFSSMRRDLQGYYWDFPSLIAGTPHMNSGVYDSRFDQGGERADLPALLEAGLGRPPRQIEGHPIHWFSPDNDFSVPGALLVGDAAGADPLFGEGIGIALGYGAAAAAELQRGWEQQSYAFRGYRRRVLMSSVGGYLLLRWLGAQILYHARQHEWLVRVLWWVVGAVAAVVSPAPKSPVSGRRRQAT